MGITLITNSAPFSEIGSKTLSSYLNKFGVSTKIIYLNNIFKSKLSETEKKQILKISKGDELIGISLMTKDYFLFKDISGYVKEKSKTPIVWGGIHPSVCPEESLSCCDYVCIGEGEEPLFLLYNSIKKIGKTGSIPNLAYRKNGRIIYPVKYYAVKDINGLPFPDYNFKNDYILENDRLIRIGSLTDIQKQKILGKTLLFYSQRGCPFSCTYCSNNVLKNISLKASVNFYRKTDIHRIIKELKYYTRKYKFINKIVINDDDFLARTDSEIKSFSNRYLNEIKIPFWVNAVPTFVTSSKIENLTGAGLTQISMGIQTGSKYILKEIYKRYLYPEEVIKSVSLIKKCNRKLRVCLDLIVDNPYETDIDIIQTVKLLSDIPKPFNLQIHSLVFFPGTELYKKAMKDKIISKNDKQAYHKRYQTDIKSSYLNFVLLLNSLVNIPRFINNLFVSRLVLTYRLFAPLRMFLAINVKVLIFFKGVKSLLSNPELFTHYLKYLKINNNA